MSYLLQKSYDTLAIEDGALRFNKEVEYKRSHGMISQVEWGLFKKALPIVEEAVANLKSKGGPIQEWRGVLEEIGAINVAYITLNEAFTAALGNSPVTSVATRVGKGLLNQLRIKDKEYDFIVKLGIQTLMCTKDTGIFEFDKGHDGYEVISFTDEAVKEIQNRQDWQQYMYPVFRPMVSKPRSTAEGSYIDPRLALATNMVRTHNKEQKRLLEALKASQGVSFIKAVDSIQEVPLKINQWILPVIEEAYHRNLCIGSIPSSVLPDGKSHDIRRLRSQIKSQQAGFLTDMEEAKHFSSFDPIYLPATMDFRGRVYAKPHLNHQRSDYVKSLWLFSEGKELTVDGVRYLKIHIANCGDFDKMSKASFKDRVKWVDDNFVRIYETVKAPMEDLWWTNADSPFCFLAACHELVNFVDVGASYVCHLPVAIDGSCSGLQHYSAMLRDPVGGKSVNLISSDKPEDVYKEVAGIVNELVMNDREDPMAKEWLDHKIDRKVTKRATMTLCYGSKQYGWREQLMEDFMAKYSSQVATGALEKHPFSDPKKASGYMSKKLDIALRMTVKAAVDGMDWLQETAGLLAKENLPIKWITPMGFPVINGYYEPIEKRIDIKVNGKRFTNKLLIGYTEDLKGSKQRTTIAPNFVHSFDACHLMMVALGAKEAGIDNFLLIHDSFGCLPSDMEEFSGIVKGKFVELYTNNDPFMTIYNNAMMVLSDKGKKKLTLPPSKGTLDLKEVQQSHYAFA